MIKPQSVQRRYTVIWSGDDALNLPEDAEERARLLKLARETGDWSGIIQPGAVPTLFHVKPLTGSALNYYTGEVSRLSLNELEAQDLALRIALLDVDNFGTHKVQRITDKAHGQSIAHPRIIDAIYDECGELGRKIIAEISGVVLARASESLSPPS